MARWAQQQAELGLDSVLESEQMVGVGIWPALGTLKALRSVREVSSV